MYEKYLYFPNKKGGNIPLYYDYLQYVITSLEASAFVVLNPFLISFQLQHIQ